MNELMELAVPSHTGAGDWERVLRDARRRRLGVRSALAFACAAAVAVAVLAGTPSSTLERALAATGTGDVLYFVFESDPPRVEVDLRTGSRKDLRGRHEVWFDPRGETFERETVAGEVLWAGPNASDHGREIYSSLLTGYRDALRNGTARVLDDGWINIAPGHDVRVSDDTYRPVAMRVGGHVTRILEYQTIDAAPRIEPVRPSLQLKPRPGTLLMEGSTGVMEVDGRLVTVHSPDPEETIRKAQRIGS